MKNIQYKFQDIKPVKLLELELSEPLQGINSIDMAGNRIYQIARVLIRLHSFPIGMVDIHLIQNLITPAELAVLIWSQLGEQINNHLRQDMLPEQDHLPKTGFQFDAFPECLKNRQALLSEAPLISVVVATRDRVHSLSSAMDTLSSLEYPNYEIIVVDNAPKTNETHEYITAIQPRFSQNNISLRYVREDTPGLAVAHNRALELVRGSIVAFTDDDVRVDRYWLVEILSGFFSNQNVGCVTGLVIPLELETPAQLLFEEFGGFTKGFSQKIFDLDGHHPQNPLFPYAAGRFGTGANMAFKTSLLKETGGFDPALGIGTPALGADDMASFFMAINQGKSLVYQPSALVYHQHRRTYEGLRKQMYGYGVGLTAFITKCVYDHPGVIFDLVSRLPTGLRYALDPASPKNQHKSSNYPRELELLEFVGMLYGPIAYLRSRWHYRKNKNMFHTDQRNEQFSQAPAYLVANWREDYQRDKNK